jgi:hypothetical protein
MILTRTGVKGLGMNDSDLYEEEEDEVLDKGGRNSHNKDEDEEGNRGRALRGDNRPVHPDLECRG